MNQRESRRRGSLTAVGERLNTRINALVEGADPRQRVGIEVLLGRVDAREVP